MMIIVVETILRVNPRYTILVIPGAVSYNLNSLDIPSETKGIKLKLNSEENGEVEVTFDLKTVGSNEKLTTNVDLSNMQLK